jgi:hypothetical protein
MSMNQRRALTKAIALRCLKKTTRSKVDNMVDKKYRNHVDLREYTGIDTDAARLLAQHPGGLDLGGLTTLTDAAAQLLASHQGPRLYLDGLSVLSNQAAAALARYQGHLTASGLIALPVSDGHLALARKLADCGSRKDPVTYNPEDELSLRALLELSVPAAEALGGAKGKRISFGALENLSGPAARGLAKFKGPELIFSGVKTLSPGVARALAQFRGLLVFGSLKALSLDAARALAPFKGQLALHSVEVVSPQVAGALAKVRGTVDLPALTELKGSAGHVALATKLAGQECLMLSELTELSDECALALAKHRGRESLSIGVASLSSTPARVELAKAIARMPPKTWVYLDNLVSMADELAAGLARRNGWLSLKGIKEMSPEAAKALASIKVIDLGSEGKKLINAAKRASLKSSAKAPVRKTPLGCPDSVWEWLRGGVLVVKAEADSVIELADAAELDYEILANATTQPWVVLNGVGVYHQTPDGHENMAGFMSMKLQTRAVHLWYDDTSGMVGYSVYDSGQLMEQYTNEGDITESEFSSQLTTSSPSQLKPLEDCTGIDGRFIHQRFQELGIGLPKSAR